MVESRDTIAMVWRALLLVSLVVGVGSARGQEIAAKCSEPTLTDAQIKQIVDRERSARTDIRPADPNANWAVKRKGCHYLYTELDPSGLPDSGYTIVLNQKGVIVDASSPRVTPPTATPSAGCPKDVLSSETLRESVARERIRRPDLPPPFADFEVKVARLRCLYLYFEYAKPPVPGKYQAFTIDPYGEVLDFSRGSAARSP
jgi:hypothetical protein